MNGGVLLKALGGDVARIRGSQRRCVLIKHGVLEPLGACIYRLNGCGDTGRTGALTRD